MVTKKRLLRTISSIGAGTIAITGLVACSPGGEGDSSSSQTLTIGMNAGLVESFEGYAEEFMADNEGWTITVEAVPDAQPDYIQQLVTENLSGTAPDIIFNYDSLNQTLAGNELLYDLRPWLDEDRGGMSTDDFLPNFLAQYEVGDRITGIPVSADSGMLFYNADVFEQYGIDELPTADWTLDDMYRVAQQITDTAGGAAYGILTPIGDSTAYFSFYPVLRAYGSNIYDAESEQFVFANDEGIEAWTELLRPYTEEFGTPYEQRADGQALFASGQLAMYIAARPQVATFRETLTSDWNVEQQPQVDGMSTTGGGSYSLSISAQSENREAAWEFMTWFYSTDGGMAAAEPNGVVPATVDGLENGSWQNDSESVPSNLIPVTTYAVENAILPDAIPDEVQPDVVPALTRALEQVVLQGTSVEEAYTAAQDELNGLLE